MIRVEISEDAQADLNEGFLFYEAQEPGLGDYFIACLRADIEGLKVSAGAHRVVYADYHRLLSKVFLDRVRLDASMLPARYFLALRAVW
ncbi:MAG: type II toxin-antitoxin system RelE/ParE family toxin [Limisphaerales bacterium]